MDLEKKYGNVFLTDAKRIKIHSTLLLDPDDFTPLQVLKIKWPCEEKPKLTVDEYLELIHKLKELFVEET